MEKTFFTISQMYTTYIIFEKIQKYGEEVVFFTVSQMYTKIDLFNYSHVLEKELNSLNKKHLNKDDEYNKVADGLQKQLSSLKHQLQVLQKEKDRAMKDKENLLNEVK